MNRMLRLVVACGLFGVMFLFEWRGTILPDVSSQNFEPDDTSHTTEPTKSLQQETNTNQIRTNVPVEPPTKVPVQAPPPTNVPIEPPTEVPMEPPKTAGGCEDLSKSTTPLNEYGPFDPCLTQANQDYIQPYIEEWQQKNVPILSSLIQAPTRQEVVDWKNGTRNTKDKEATSSSRPVRHYTAIFATSYLPKPGGSETHWRRRYALEATWYCNNERATPVGTGDSRNHALVVQCPYNTTYQDSQDPLTTIRVETDDDSELPSSMTYDVKHHACCSSQPTTPPLYKMVACPLIKYETPRQLLLQWVEYHRLLGVDYFFVYLNEAYNRTEMKDQLPALPYISYVSFDLQKPGDGFLFQRAQQNDCVYRSRSHGADWALLNDVDEYFQVLGNQNQEGDGALRSFLKPYESQQIGGIRAQNMFFPLPDGGRSNNNTWMDMDVVDRNEHCIPLGREKIIARPEHVDYPSVHFILDGLKTLTLNCTTELRHNHYRHVSLKKLRKQQNGDVTPVRDTSLRDNYRDRVAKRLEEMYQSFSNDE